MSSDRVARLEALGFVWDVVDELRETNFRKLVSYQAKFGDCNVPEAWREDPKLATWVGNQRRLMRKGLLNDVRVGYLEGIGFKRNLKKGPRTKT